jgi:type IV pilus assembly protein PilN
LIEINLHPTTGRKGGRRKKAGGGLSLPKIPAFGTADPYVLGIGVAWVAGLALAAFMVLGVRQQKASVENDLARARNDSTNLAAQIQDNERIRQQRDSIGRKLLLIQDLDDGRYIWPHIMDEVSRALPNYIWLTGLNHVQGDSLPVFQIQGNAGTNFALTQFMRDLEASPFISNVRLARTAMATLGDDVLNDFMLEARYRRPPAELIETVPLIVVQEVN